MIGLIRHTAQYARNCSRATIRLSSTYAKNSQIYIHKDNEVDRYSFSSNPKAIHIGQISSHKSPTPEQFEVNSRFLSILHETIGTKVYDDFTFIMEAGMNASSYMPIYDFRETPRYARVPEIENVFGYVSVDSAGKMIRESYQENSMYRVCSGTSGLPKLSDYLYEQVQEKCEDCK